MEGFVGSLVRSGPTYLWGICSIREYHRFYFEGADMIGPQNYNQEVECYRQGKLAGEPVFEKSIVKPLRSDRDAMLIAYGVAPEDLYLMVPSDVEWSTIVKVAHIVAEAKGRIAV